MKFEVTSEIAHPRSRVWGILERFGDVYKVNPVVQESFIVGDKEKGVGAVRECRFYDGNSVREEVMEWKEDRYLKLRLFGGSMPIVWGYGCLEVEDAGPGKSTLTACVEMKMKYGILGSLMGLMMKPMMKAQFRKIFRSYEEHLSTGKNIGKGGVLLDADVSTIQAQEG